MSSFTVQCAVLMRKNLLQRYRTATFSLLEILFPVVIIAALPLLQTLFRPTLQPGQSNLNAATRIPPVFSLFSGLALAGTGGRLALTSSSSAGAAAAARFHADMVALFPSVPLDSLGGGVLTAAEPALASITLPGWGAATTLFSSERELEAYTQQAGYSAPGGPPPIFAALVFNDDLPTLDYTLRFNASALPTTELYVQGFVNNFNLNFVRQYLNSPAPASSPLGLSNASRLGPAFQAYDSVILPGFHSLQLLVDRWAINATVPTAALNPDLVATLFTSACVGLAPGVGLGSNPFLTLPAAIANLTPPARAALVADVAARLLADQARAPQQVDVLPFPTPPFTFDPFFQFALPNLGILMLLGYMPTVIRSVGRIVQEKELRMRESMLSMGLSEAALFASHFGSLLLTNTCVAVGITALLGATVFSRSSAGLLFLLFFSWGCALAAQTYLISIFFIRAKVASNLSGILFWLAYFPFIALTPQSGGAARGAVSLLAPANLIGAWQSMATLEGARVGLTPATVGVPSRGWSIADSIAMFYFTCVLYLALAFYLEAVLPAAYRDFGVPRSPFFPCLPSYWREALGRGRGGGGAAQGAPSPSSPAQPPALAKFFEAPDADQLAKEAAGRAVVLQGMRKEFDTPDGLKVALDGVSMALHEGQITCLLGHNGAGKTTIISILTGLLPSTAGRATVFGSSLENMAAVRQHCGVCPQQDVLWPDLTVWDHLLLFATIKGVDRWQAAAECTKALAMVGLTEKRDVRTAVLSGGQKRKLHVAIAFMGKSKFIILDEPTSGMDPYSRRSTWQQIQSAREGRVILLTTHFMDEADVLADKVVMLSHGRVECCGSPLFLKKAFDIGYSLTLVRAPPHSTQDAPPPSDAMDQAILSMVKEHVPEAAIMGAAGMELTLRLPIPSAPLFPPLLRDLEGARGAALGVRDMGIHVTSVEDVFLRVAQGKMGASAAQAEEGGVVAVTSLALAALAPLGAPQHPSLPSLELPTLSKSRLASPRAALPTASGSVAVDVSTPNPVVAVAAWGEPAAAAPRKPALPPPPPPQPACPAVLCPAVQAAAVRKEGQGSHGLPAVPAHIPASAGHFHPGGQPPRPPAPHAAHHGAAQHAGLSVHCAGQPAPQCLSRLYLQEQRPAVPRLARPGSPCQRAAPRCCGAAALLRCSGC